MTILDIELDQCLGMFGDERDRHHEQAHLVPRGALDLGLVLGPIQRCGVARDW